MRLSEIEANIPPWQRIDRRLFEHFWPSSSGLYVPTDGAAAINWAGLYSPAAHRFDGRLLEHSAARLSLIIKRDFPSVKRLQFVVDPKFELVANQGFYTFKGVGTITADGEDWPSGFSTINDGHATVIVQQCRSLVELVDTAIHEAAHIEYKSDACNLPNRISAERIERYLTLMFT